MKTNNKGFSLVELIVVIAIMAILAAVAIPTFAGFITKANVASDVSSVAKEVNAVYVTVNNNKEPTAIVVKIDNGNEEDITVTVTSAGAVTPTTGYDWAKDIASAMEWTYNFKSIKTNQAGNYYVDNNKLVKAAN